MQINKSRLKYNWLISYEHFIVIVFFFPSEKIYVSKILLLKFTTYSDLEMKQLFFFQSGKF